MNEVITVFSTEFIRRLRSRPFLFGTIAGMLFVAFLMLAPRMIGNAVSKAGNTIVLVGTPELTATAKTLLADDFRIVGTEAAIAHPSVAYLDKHGKAAAAIELVKRGHGLRVTAFVRDLGTFDSRQLRRDLGPLNVALQTKTPAGSVNSMLEIPLQVRGLSGRFSSEGSAFLAKGIAYALIFLLYLSTILNSQFTMTSVAEEKTSRVAELLVATINPSALLAGKILAAGALGALQVASWLVVSLMFGSHAVSPYGSAASNVAPIANIFSAAITPIEIFAFIVFFIIGFFQYALMFAAMGSLVSRTEDIGSMSFPLIMPVVGAFLLAQYALGFPSAPLSVGFSFVPLIAPFVMFARIAVSTVPAWQIALSVGVNLLATWLILVLAGKIYRVGMLLYGRPPKAKQILAALRS